LANQLSLSPRRERVRVRGNNLKNIFDEGENIWKKKN